MFSRSGIRWSVLILLTSVVGGIPGCEKGPPPLVTKPAGSPPRTRITNVFVFDGRSPFLMPPRDVILEDGRIKAIVGKDFMKAEGERIIDGTSGILMPPLEAMTDKRGRPLAARATPTPPPVTAPPATIAEPTGGIFPASSGFASMAFPALFVVGIIIAGAFGATVGGHPVGALEALVPWWIRWYVKWHMTREVGTSADARAAVQASAVEARRHQGRRRRYPPVDPCSAARSCAPSSTRRAPTASGPSPTSAASTMRSPPPTRVSRGGCTASTRSAFRTSSFHALGRSTSQWSRRSPYSTTTPTSSSASARRRRSSATPCRPRCWRASTRPRWTRSRSSSSSSGCWRRHATRVATTSAA